MNEGCDDLSQYNQAQARMLGVFVVLEVVAFCLIFLFVPETAKCKASERDALNHMSLEELNAVFEQPTFHHTKWRIQEALPHRLRWAIWRLTPGRNPDEEPEMEVQVHRWESEKDNVDGPSRSGAQDRDSQGTLLQPDAVNSTARQVTGGHAHQNRAASSDTAHPAVMNRVDADGSMGDEITPARRAHRHSTDNNNQSTTFHLNHGTTMPNDQQRPQPRRFY